MTEDEVRELELTVLVLAHQLAAFPYELETALRQGLGMQLLPQLVSVARNARLRRSGRKGWTPKATPACRQQRWRGYPGSTPLTRYPTAIRWH